jgi:hypothetical protein
MFITYLEGISEEEFNLLPSEVLEFYHDVVNFYNIVGEMPKVIIDGFSLDEIVLYNLPVDENYFELDGEITVLHPRLSQHSLSKNYRDYVKTLDESLLPNIKSRIYDYEQLRKKKAVSKVKNKALFNKKVIYDALGGEQLNMFITKMVIEKPDIYTNELYQILRLKKVPTNPRTVSVMRANALKILKTCVEFGRIKDEYVDDIIRASYGPVELKERKKQANLRQTYLKNRKTAEKIMQLEDAGEKRFNEAIKQQEKGEKNNDE